MARKILVPLALSLLGALGCLLLPSCQKAEETNESSALEAAGQTRTITVAGKDFSVFDGEGGGIEEDGFNVEMTYWEIIKGQIQLAADRSSMIFPTFDWRTHPRYHYVSISFVALDDPYDTMVIYETNSAGEETVIKSSLTNWSANYEKDIYGTRICNRGVGNLRFSSVTVTIAA
jgi:hypothetical protein